MQNIWSKAYFYQLNQPKVPHPPDDQCWLVNLGQKQHCCWGKGWSDFVPIYFAVDCSYFGGFFRFSILIFSMFVFLLVFQISTIHLIPWFKHYDPNRIREVCTWSWLNIKHFSRIYFSIAFQFPYENIRLFFVH